MANDVQISFIGGLGADPELKYGQDGKPRCRISVAANPSRFDKQANQWEAEGEPQWYSATEFGDKAELWAEYLHKGDKVRIEGQLVHRPWTGDDGQQRISREIKNPRLTLPLRKPQEASQDRFSAPQTQNATSYQSGAYNAPQTAQNDPAGNLAQAGLWRGSDQRAPF